MKKITYWCYLMVFLTGTLYAQGVQPSQHLENSVYAESQELRAHSEHMLLNDSSEARQQNTRLQQLLTRYNALGPQSKSPSQIFSSEELSLLSMHFRRQNAARLADFIPTAGATESFDVAEGDFFFDPGGPGGSSTGGTPGNYPNCGCITVSTLNGASEIEFLFFSVFSTFDWLRIYDGADTSGTVLYDNNTGGANQGDITLADMIGSNGSALFTSTTGSFTFEFRASAVVDYGGWEVEVLSGGGGNPPTGDILAYATENGLGLFGSFDVEEPATFNVIGGNSGTTQFEGAGALDPNDLGIAYVIDNVGEAWSVDVATGVYTSLGNVGTSDITGMEFNPVDGVLYAIAATAATSQLYTVDIAGLSTTLVGPLSTGANIPIALAIDGEGDAYTYSIIDDNFWSIDLTTGTSTVIGPIGFDANFGQGMSWHPVTDVIYMSAFNNGIFDSELRTVDRATGATTLVGGMQPGALTQYGWMSIPSEEILPPPIACDEMTYDATGLPVDIDGAGTSTADCTAAPNLVPVSVTESGTIGNGATIVSVTIDITHTFNGDLDIFLISPEGTEFMLSTDNGSTGDNYTQTVFQDGAPSITTGTSPFTGTFSAEGGTFATAFEGEDIEGDWQLKVCDDAGGDTGTINQFTMVICVPEPVDNNLCINAYEITCGEIIAGDTSDNTNTGGSNASPDEWYSFTGNGETQLIQASLCTGTSYDSVLTVFDSCGGAVVATNDDSCGVQSEVNFVSDGTTTYYIAVEGFGTATGTFSLELTCSDPLVNDECSGAIDVTCNTSIEGTTIGATPDTASVPACNTAVTAPGVWYVYEDTSGLISDITVSTCDGITAFDSKLSVYTGDCGTLTCVGDNDDDCGLQSSVDFQSDGNTTYYILVHGFGGAAGEFTLNIDCTPVPPPNDMIVNSIDVDQIGVPYTDPNVAMPAATTENGNPTGCNINGANGVWYNFTTNGPGTATASITTPGGVSFVSFYTAPNENATEADLTLVDQNSNQCVPSTATTINTVADQTYYVFVVNSGAITDIVIDGTNLSVDSNTIEGFSFYPNPASTEINFSAVNTIETVSLYNMLGQKVVDQTVRATSSNINVSNLTTGAYLMKVTADGKTGTYKVIIK